MSARSGLMYRGPGQHVCHRCGGALVLAEARDERRSGHERRSRVDPLEGPEWRSGYDRREAARYEDLP